jgi:hypothetical protein
VRLDEDGGAVLAGVVDCRVDVGHLERQVVDAVAVLGDMAPTSCPPGPRR